jgi:hypothetical protein
MMSAYTTHRFYAAAAEVLSACAREKVPYFRPFGRSAYAQRGYLETEVIYLPLSDDGETISHIFGALEVNAPIPV